MRLLLLGGVEMQGVDTAAAARVLAQPRLVALMALLALSPGGLPQRRDRLVGLLWPEQSQQRARAALRKAVHVVRSALGAEVLVGRGDEELALRSPPFQCDAAELQVASTQGQMARVVELYRDELMPGFHVAASAEFDRWLEQERASARECAAAAALALATAMEADERFTTAGRLAKKAVTFQWDDERVVRRAMQMLARIQDHAGALRLYAELEKRMKEELDAAPSAESRALADALRGLTA